MHKALLYFFFLAVCFVCVQSSSPCVFDEGEYYDYEETLECFMSIPLTDDIKFTTLATLNRSLELYTFYDIAHNSPDPNLPMQVNMQQGLQEIASRDYLTDFDFQNDLRSLYLQVCIVINYCK